MKNLMPKPLTGCYTTAGKPRFSLGPGLPSVPPRRLPQRPSGVATLVRGNAQRNRRVNPRPSTHSNPDILNPMKPNTLATLALIASAGWAIPGAADWTDARCDIYPKGSDHTDKMIPCTFGQRQGFITITRKDGVTHELTPVGDAPGNFRDQHGRPVYRQSGLGTQGQIFRFEDESVYVYWDTSALNPSKEDNPTAPFSTRDYDATTRLRCKAATDSEYGRCPAGILRMENRQASVVIQSQLGERFTINFMTGYVNATNHQVDARRQGDTWIVTLDNGEVYEVPLAAIEGG